MHNIEYYSHPENCNKKKVESELNTYVTQQTYQEGRHGLDRPIRWLNVGPLPDYDAAKETIEAHDSGWYDQLAVRYRELPANVSNKKIEELKNKAAEVYQTLMQLEKKVAAKDFKAQLVSCKKCGSKLNKDYLNSNFCPLCRADMRSDTTQKRIAALRQKHQELQEVLRKEQAALAAKKGKVMWLVKIEYHT